VTDVVSGAASMALQRPLGAATMECDMRGRGDRERKYEKQPGYSLFHAHTYVICCGEQES